MAFIKLTRDRVAIVDDELFEDINKYLWCFNGLYASRGNNIYMHRVIMSAPKGVLVDHINGNGLDNRRENLRLCTHAQNLQNQKRKKNNTSGIKGVSWCSKSRKWDARIRLNMKQFYLGKFSSKEDAANAYAQAALKYHGEFARTS